MMVRELMEVQWYLHTTFICGTVTITDGWVGGPNNNPPSAILPFCPVFIVRVLNLGDHAGTFFLSFELATGCCYFIR